MRIRTNNIKNIGLVLSIISSTLFIAAQASAAVITRDFDGNDCKGVFNPNGGGFDACTIFVNDAGENIELSPVIAKFGYDELGNWMETETNSLYPSVDGNEFTVNLNGNGETGNWNYSPGTDDPGVRYWAAKAGSGFTLFWEVDAAAASGVCNVSDTYTLDCLNEALVVETGDWTTPEDKELSHITFYDTAIVPVPAAAWLFGSALLGLAGLKRKQS